MIRVHRYLLGTSGLQAPKHTKYLPNDVLDTIVVGIYERALVESYGAYLLIDVTVPLKCLSCWSVKIIKLGKKIYEVWPFTMLPSADVWKIHIDIHGSLSLGSGPMIFRKAVTQSEIRPR